MATVRNHPKVTRYTEPDGASICMLILEHPSSPTFILNSHHHIITPYNCIPLFYTLGDGIKFTHVLLLLPPRTVQLEQNLIACTIQIYLYSHYGPYGLYSTAIPLHRLWTIRPVQSRSACTEQVYLYSHQGQYGLYRNSVPVQYSYTANHTMDFTACKETRCLNSTAI